MPQRIVILFIAAVLMVPAITQAGLTSMRGPLFESTDQARARAEALNASLRPLL